MENINYFNLTISKNLRLLSIQDIEHNIRMRVSDILATLDITVPHYDMILSKVESAKGEFYGVIYGYVSNANIFYIMTGSNYDGSKRVELIPRDIIQKDETSVLKKSWADTMDEEEEGDSIESKLPSLFHYVDTAITPTKRQFLPVDASRCIIYTRTGKNEYINQDELIKKIRVIHPPVSKNCLIDNVEKIVEFPFIKCVKGNDCTHNYVIFSKEHVDIMLVLSVLRKIKVNDKIHIFRNAYRTEYGFPSIIDNIEKPIMPLMKKKKIKIPKSNTRVAPAFSLLNDECNS